VAWPECKSQRMTGQGTRGGRYEGNGSFDHGDGMSMGGVFLGRVGVFRISSRPASTRRKERGAAEIYSVGQSVIPIRTLPSPSTQVSCV
jgi:hypothetical protein